MLLESLMYSSAWELYKLLCQDFFWFFSLWKDGLRPVAWQIRLCAVAACFGAEVCMVAVWQASLCFFPLTCSPKWSGFLWFLEHQWEHWNRTKLPNPASLGSRSHAGKNRWGFDFCLWNYPQVSSGVPSNGVPFYCRWCHFPQLSLPCSKLYICIVYISSFP